MMAERFALLNGRFDAVTATEATSLIVDLARCDSGARVGTVNVAMLMMMRRDRDLQRFMDSCAITVADGQPLVWLSELFGDALPARVAGVDLVESVCAGAADAGVTVYLLGGSIDVVGQVACALDRRHPGVIAGYAGGHFGPDEALARARAVARSGARLVFVGMGVPRQERFIAEYQAAMGDPVCIGVGGSFDVIAGKRRRAPAWMQRLGLEWTFRLLQEPRRLAKRYATTGMQFLVLSIRAFVAPSWRTR
jgi:N-acetylglucosaminyldiphosphoundecaprenol N-acetyl-beta-D-mannosaminyltransferase